MQELKTEKLQPIELPQLKEKPLVSILIANYNYEKYIGETLESVLSQTYPNWEAIVCDDGSKDNSCEVIETYVKKDSRIKLIRQQNGGQAAALAVAYQQSNGQIVCLLDSDDLWMPNKLQKVLDAFKSDLKCGFVIHNVIEINSQGELIKSTPMLNKLASGWRAPFALLNGGFAYNIPPSSALCIRREVSDLFFHINEEFIGGGDTLICHLVPLVTVIVPVPEVLSKYRKHSASYTSFSTLTADGLKQHLNVLESVHQEQRQLLKKVYGAEVAEKLTGLEASETYLNRRYLFTRLKGEPKLERREAHRQLVAHPQFGKSITERWLQWGEYLPDALFVALIDFIYGSSPLKRLVKLIFGRVINSSKAKADW
ncbi:MAG: glycosyltransferase [Tolypothrix brevis GSE-NOS-MK-07-07A]|jgi:glycosyltransferase involved in cell wall biosynthesis|nr:glycosyltransferase [Tolypothrix brevis GSE-NOS-MK-07-07A]